MLQAHVGDVFGCTIGANKLSVVPGTKLHDLRGGISFRLEGKGEHVAAVVIDNDEQTGFLLTTKREAFTNICMEPFSRSRGKSMVGRI